MSDKRCGNCQWFEAEKGCDNGDCTYLVLAPDLPLGLEIRWKATGVWSYRGLDATRCKCWKAIDA